MNFKIAVCLYGQPRTWRYCLPWIKASFPETIDSEVAKISDFDQFRFHTNQSMGAELSVDYFMHVKDYNTYQNTTINSIDRLTNQEISEIITAYNPKKHEVITLEQDVALHEREQWWHYRKMFDSISKAVALKRQHEQENDFVYDLVVLHRFDCLLGAKPTEVITNILRHGIEPMSIFTPTKDNFKMYNELWKSGFDDMVMCGDSLGIDLLCAWMYRKYEGESKNNLVDYRLGPNVTITDAMHECNLTKRHVRGDIAIVRPNADLSKPVFENFMYHRYFWINNHTLVE